eukprot:143113_1
MASRTTTIKEQPAHRLVFHYGNKLFEYKLVKGFDPNNSDLFESIVKAVQNRFKLHCTINMFDFQDYNFADMTSIVDLIDNDDALHLNIQCVVPNEDDDMKSNEVVKRMSECANEHAKDMIQFHHDITAKIRKNYRDDFTKTQIECENLYHVLESLNTARPRMEKDYDTMNVLWQQNILFWQRYAHMRLIQWNVETCITERVGIETVLFETKAFEGHEPFEHKYSQILQIIRKYHTLYQNADKSAFDVLLASIKDIQIEIQSHQRPVDPNGIVNGNATLQYACTENEKPQKMEDMCRIYFYLNEEHVTKVFVKFTAASTGESSKLHPMGRVIGVNKRTKLYYKEVNIPWTQHQTSKKVQFLWIYRGLGSIDTWQECDGERELRKGSLGYYSTHTTLSWYYTDIQRIACDGIIEHIIKQRCHTYDSYTISSQMISMHPFRIALKQSEPHASSV